MVVAANWKMYKTGAELDDYFAAFGRSAPSLEEGIEVAFFPPFSLLSQVVEAIGGRSDTSVGAQNCHWADEGAHTGEISPRMIAACGARRVLIGHSERRQEFGESDDLIARKLEAALQSELVPILCVGETLEERERGRARAVVVEQLTRATNDLDREQYARLTVAYEPIWAIGTGRTAEPADAQEMHLAIREIVGSIATPEVARRVPVLYGGSVKPDNAADLMSRPDVDGALVGGASLDPDSFAAIVTAASLTR
jgi:triosephosphate isomerase